MQVWCLGIGFSGGPAGLGQWVDLLISEVFSNLRDFLIQINKAFSLHAQKMAAGCRLKNTRNQE